MTALGESSQCFTTVLQTTSKTHQVEAFCAKTVCKTYRPTFPTPKMPEEMGLGKSTVCFHGS